MTILEFSKGLIAEGAQLSRGSYTLRMAERDVTIGTVTFTLREYAKKECWTCTVSANLSSVYGRVNLFFMQTVEGEYNVIGPGMPANIIAVVKELWATLGGATNQTQPGNIKGQVKDYFPYRIPSKMPGVVAYGEGNYFAGQFAWLVNYANRKTAMTTFAWHKKSYPPSSVQIPILIDFNLFQNLKSRICNFMARHFHSPEDLLPSKER